MNRFDSSIQSTAIRWMISFVFTVSIIPISVSVQAEDEKKQSTENTDMKTPPAIKSLGNFPKEKWKNYKLPSPKEHAKAVNVSEDSIQHVSHESSAENLSPPSKLNVDDELLLPKNVESSDSSVLNSKEQSSAPQNLIEETLSNSNQKSNLQTGIPKAGSKQKQSKPELIVKRVNPESVTANDRIIVQIHITNDGGSPAQNVKVTEQIPADILLGSSSPKATKTESGVEWMFEAINPGETKIVEWQGTIKEQSKLATIQSDTVVTFEERVSSGIRILRPNLELTCEGPDEVVLGESAEYLITVKNIGDVNANNLVLEVPLPEGLKHLHGPHLENRIGTLGIGQSRTVNLNLQIAKAGQIPLEVTAICDGVDRKVDRLDVTSREILVKLYGQAPAAKYLGHAIDYNWSMQNEGSVEAEDIELVVHIPDNIRIRGIKDGGRWNAKERTVVWSLERMSPGERRNISLTGVSEAIEPTVCVAKLIQKSKVLQEKKLETEIRGVAAIAVETLDLNDPVFVGSEALYEIRIINQGSLNATNIRVEAVVPPELQFVSANGPTQFTQTGNRIVFQPIDKLVPRADITYRIKAVGKVAGDSRFRVEVQTDQLKKPVNEEESTMIYGE